MPRARCYEGAGRCFTCSSKRRENAEHGLYPASSDSWAGWRLLYRELADNHQQPTSFSNLNQQTSYLRISSVHLKLAENYIVPSYLYPSLRSPSVPVIVSRSAADPYSRPQRAGQLQAQEQLQHLFEY
jgi:hypothetical protein